VNEDHDLKRTDDPCSRVSRRGFLESVGVGMTGIAVASNLSARDAEELTEDAEPKKLSLVINGRKHMVDSRTAHEPAVRPPRKAGDDRNQAGM
jgi:hypothetical protein